MKRHPSRILSGEEASVTDSSCNNNNTTYNNNSNSTTTNSTSNNNSDRDNINRQQSRGIRHGHPSWTSVTDSSRNRSSSSNNSRGRSSNSSDAANGGNSSDGREQSKGIRHGHPSRKSWPGIVVVILAVVIAVAVAEVILVRLVITVLGSRGEASVRDSTKGSGRRHQSRIMGSLVLCCLAWSECLRRNTLIGEHENSCCIHILARFFSEYICRNAFVGIPVSEYFYRNS